jgi:hypothetical protein
MIPTNDHLILLHSTIPLIVIDHILHRLVSCIDTRLGPLNGQGERVHDVERSILNLAVHQAHDLVLPAGTSVNDHFDERDGGDFDRLEVMGTVKGAMRD